MSKGFTLAEILVVIAVVAIFGTILVLIFTNTLRGSNKSQVLAVIKQNGQSVLENMDKTIRNASNVVCPVSSGNTVVIERNGTYTRYRIVLSTDTFGTAPDSCRGSGTNGCIVQDNPVKQPDPATGQLETDTAFINRICLLGSLMSSAQVLTDTNPMTGVSIGSGFFSVSKSSGFKAVVTVNFVLKPGVSLPQIIVSQIDPVTYQTTIGLR